MTHAFSILITYHNEKELLTECLNSIYRQLDPCDEILIYDDASQFPPQKYIPKGVRARVIRGNENRGPAYGRNVLLQEARGEYIHFHDADDLFAENWARNLRRTFIATHCEVVFTEVASFKAGEALSQPVVGLSELKASPTVDSLIRFCISHFMLVPCGTYRKKCVHEIGGYRETLWQSEDFDFHVRLAASGIRYEVILQPLVSIRLRKESRSQNRFETARDAVLSLESLGNELRPEFHQALAEKASFMGSQLFQLGHRKEARTAFKLAKKLGPPSYTTQTPAYQWFARSWGQEYAEWFATFYRLFFPNFVRRTLRG